MLFGVQPRSAHRTGGGDVEKRAVVPPRRQSGKGRSAKGIVSVAVLRARLRSRRRVPLGRSLLVDGLRRLAGGGRRLGGGGRARVVAAGPYPFSAGFRQNMPQS
jgi:hypothetical protein